MSCEPVNLKPNLNQPGQFLQRKNLATKYSVPQWHQMNKAKMFHANRARMGAENIIDVSRTAFSAYIWKLFITLKMYYCTQIDDIIILGNKPGH